MCRVIGNRLFPVDNVELRHHFGPRMLLNYIIQVGETFVAGEQSAEATVPAFGRQAFRPQAVRRIVVLEVGE